MYRTTVSSTNSFAAFLVPYPHRRHPNRSAWQMPFQKNHVQLSIDNVYFNQKPFLHVIDDQTKWYEIGLLESRRLQDRITLLKHIQLNQYGLPDVIQGDEEFNKLPFCQFCQPLEITLVAVVAEHHYGNVIVERANRTIPERVALLAMEEPRMSLVDLLTTATFNKNTSRSYKESVII